MRVRIQWIGGSEAEETIESSRIKNFGKDQNKLGMQVSVKHKSGFFAAIIKEIYNDIHDGLELEDSHIHNDEYSTNFEDEPPTSEHFHMLETEQEKSDKVLSLVEKMFVELKDMKQSYTGLQKSYDSLARSHFQLQSKVNKLEQQHEQILNVVNTANGSSAHARINMEKIFDLLALRFTAHSATHECPTKEPTTTTTTTTEHDSFLFDDLEEPETRLNSTTIPKTTPVTWSTVPASTPTSTPRRITTTTTPKRPLEENNSFETLAGNAQIPKRFKEHLTFETAGDVSVAVISSNLNLKMPVSEYAEIVQSVDRTPRFVVRLMNKFFTKEEMKQSTFNGTKTSGDGEPKLAIKANPKLLAIFDQAKKQFPGFVMDKSVKKAITNRCLNNID